MIVTAQQMRKAEEHAFANGLEPTDVIGHASRGIARAIQALFPGTPGTVLAFSGKGNNGEDARLARDILVLAGWAATFDEDSPRPLVLLDGLLGTGSNGEPRGDIPEKIAEINRLRLHHGATTVAIDIPSGLGTQAPVTADVTISLGYAKTALLEDAASTHVGRIIHIDLPEIPPPAGADTTRALLTTTLLAPWLPRRDFDSHKGDAGRIAILAGGKGTIGAAVLCATAAARAGAGLTTLFVPGNCYQIAAIKAPPEIMVRTTRDLPGFRHDVLAAGPGLGTGDPELFHKILRESDAPAVLDADALNMLDLTALKNRTSPCLLTPHPGEMARMIGNEVGDRTTCAREFATTHPGHTLLLKGSRTIIATEGKTLLYNTTGHPGMATGGMGDVLTGIAAAFLATTRDTHQAAALASHIAGRAAELATGNLAPEPLLASDLFSQLPTAINEVRLRHT